MKKNALQKIGHNLYAMTTPQMNKVLGGAKMSTGYAGGSPTNGQNGYDTADKTGAGDKVSWDNTQWYDMCGNPTKGHQM